MFIDCHSLFYALPKFLKCNLQQSAKPSPCGLHPSTGPAVWTRLESIFSRNGILSNWHLEWGDDGTRQTGKRRLESHHATSAFCSPVLWRHLGNWFTTRDAAAGHFLKAFFCRDSVGSWLGDQVDHCCRCRTVIACITYTVYPKSVPLFRQL